MNEEVGIVKSTEGRLAMVSVPKKSACEGCTLGTCKPGDQSMEIEAFNQAGALVGQRVKVILNPMEYMKGSMLVYGFPALALVLGAVAGKELGGRLFPGTDSDILSALFGFGALAIAFIIVKIWTNRASGDVKAKPVIEEILN